MVTVELDRSAPVGRDENDERGMIETITGERRYTFAKCQNDNMVDKISVVKT